MAKTLKRGMVRRIAGLELNALRAAEVLPDSFDGARVGTGTPIYDPNGEVLFYRAPVRQGKRVAGSVDVAGHDALGDPILAVAPGQSWEPKALIEVARKKAGGKLRGCETRFVAYSYPKIAVQFLSEGREVAMLECYTWTPVPQKQRSPKQVNFARWSVLDGLASRTKKSRSAKLQKKLASWDRICPPRKPPRGFKPELIDPRPFIQIFKPKITTKSRELHYSTDDAHHHICYELYGQETNVWCVAASVQMILAFYRYEYAQTRLAKELGLGTPSNPNGLPYSQDGKVVTVLEAMTTNALDAAMNTSPTWSEFTGEIDDNRPLVSFVPGHSRTVAGYTRTALTFGNLKLSTYRGLLVYDPWPPNVGVITRWENFDTTTYRRTFTAQLLLA